MRFFNFQNALMSLTFVFMLCTLSLFSRVSREVQNVIEDQIIIVTAERLGDIDQLEEYDNTTECTNGETGEYPEKVDSTELYNGGLDTIQPKRVPDFRFYDFTPTVN